MSHRELISIGRDAQKTAEAADLLYVNVSSEGITRVKKGKGFSYTYQGNVVKDKKLLDRIVRDVKQRGASKLILNVNRHNRAIAFYERYGFKITGQEDIAIGEGYFMNDYIMEKDI